MCVCVCVHQSVLPSNLPRRDLSPKIVYYEREIPQFLTGRFRGRPSLFAVVFGVRKLRRVGRRVTAVGEARNSNIPYNYNVRTCRPAGVLHRVPGGGDKLRELLGHADRPRTHADRTRHRQVRGQRGSGGRHADVPVQRRREMVPAVRRLQVQSRLRGGRGRPNLYK